ncbi:MAG TPA: hypothetical protein VIV60_19185, partial [Polyangiaceae bacterium]
MTHLVVALEMGYGHLRAAYPIADALGVPVWLADEAPIADEMDRKLWRWIRQAHRLLSRPAPWSLLERPANNLMDLVTMIPPLHEKSDQSAPDLGVLALEKLVRRGLGLGLVRALRAQNATLVTTFYAPAIIADLAGCDPVYCVVTDADVQRIWVAKHPERSHIHYLAPSARVVRRLRAYGVSDQRITLTGFPLPCSNGEPDAPSALARQVARRIVRLDPERIFRDLHGPTLERLLGPLPTEEAGAPVEIVFAVGGAGAQLALADVFLPRFRDHVLRGRVRLHLVAGTRGEVAAAFTAQLRRARLTSR